MLGRGALMRGAEALGLAGGLCRGRRGFGRVLAGQRAFAEEAEMSEEEVSAALRAAQGSLSLGPGPVSHVDFNRLAANDPCEDNLVGVRCEPTASHFFGVFDGHGGRFCSEAVARRLCDYAAAAVAHRHVPGYDAFSDDHTVQLLNSAPAAADPTHAHHLQRFLAKYVRAQTDSRTTVRRALQAAFLALDEDLTADALNGHYSGDWSRRQRADALRAVISGACGCVAHVRGPHLHIANVGDSSAVLAVRQDSNGVSSWTARQLTQDHTVDNSAEVSRIRGEHPHSEQTSVLRGGRLLGELMPLRAFGDVRYKWPREVQERVLGEGVAPATLLSPPYLTALPEVYYHRLTANDKFLVIASDGLWECVSPERVVRLLADHGLGKDAIAPYEPQPHASLDQTLAALRRRKLGEGKTPLDVNSATHLLRVALGGSKAALQNAELSHTLSLPLGPARNHRDDITLQVIYFDQDYLEES